DGKGGFGGCQYLFQTLLGDNDYSRVVADDQVALADAYAADGNPPAHFDQLQTAFARERRHVSCGHPEAGFANLINITTGAINNDARSVLTGRSRRCNTAER